MTSILMKKDTESMEVLKEERSSEKDLKEPPSVSFTNKSSGIPIWVWIALVFAFLLFVAGLVCIVLATTSRSQSCSSKDPVSQVPDVCSFSEEANRVNLSEFLKKVQTEYYALNPNSVAWQPDIEQRDEHMKQR